MPQKINFPGTVLIIGPVYTRTGFGEESRAFAFGLNKYGIRVKVVSVAEYHDGIDDVPLALLKKLEKTEIVPPVVALINQVPTYYWSRMSLPEPNARILVTTNASYQNAPPPLPRVTYIAQEYDQIWLMNEEEINTWAKAGVKKDKLKLQYRPHMWANENLLPAPSLKEKVSDTFRFLNICVMRPNRRLDVLINAFLQEFKEEPNLELYLKVNYPAWHPIKGKPKKDLQDIIYQAYEVTGSRAKVVVDDEAFLAGKRSELAALIDSCDIYVSTDIMITAPVSESVLRKRLPIVTSGIAFPMPPEALVIPNEQEMVKVTEEMAEYNRHFRRTPFAALSVEKTRKFLRQAYAFSQEERNRRAEACYNSFKKLFSFENTLPDAIQKINDALDSLHKNPIVISSGEKPLVTWKGWFLYQSGIAKALREIGINLISKGYPLRIIPTDGVYRIEDIDLDERPEYRRLADNFYREYSGPPLLTIDSFDNPNFQQEKDSKYILFNTFHFGVVTEATKRSIQYFAEEVWVPSNFIKQSLVKEGIPENKLVVIPFGVNQKIYSPDGPNDYLPFKSKFNILFVGEAGKRKGLDILLDAFFQAFKNEKDVCLVIKGLRSDVYFRTAEFHAQLRELSNNSNGPRVYYIPEMIPEVELAALYRSCQVIVHPARYTGFALPVLEAMACGVPAIVPSVGPTADFCNAQNAFLLQGKQSRLPISFEGEKLYVKGIEVPVKELAKLLRTLYQKPYLLAEKREKAVATARQFNWEATTKIVEERIEFFAEKQCQTRKEESVINLSNTKVDLPPQLLKGTVLWIAPFYNRSGYGINARALAQTLHRAGARIRIHAVDDIQPGIDDFDMSLLRQLGRTPLRTPITVIISHLPSEQWLKLEIPSPHVKVLTTTFDGSEEGLKPPADWIKICQGFHKVLFATEKERRLFETEGVSAAQLGLIKWRHPWLANPILPPLTAPPEDGRVRFLTNAMFQPRRRWDTLIEAFLREFRHHTDVELRLKVLYPPWHPEPQKPRKELRQLVKDLRNKTRSKASIVIDEELGTRLELVKLYDSTDFYVSLDVAPTTPVTEAVARQRPVITVGDWTINFLGENSIRIPQKITHSRPFTPEMLKYQPHHKGRKLPILDIMPVRQALRQAYEMGRQERLQMAERAYQQLNETLGEKAALQTLLVQLKEAWDNHAQGAPLIIHASESNEQALTASSSFKVVGQTIANQGSIGKTTDTKDLPAHIIWEGDFFAYHSLALVNRELAMALMEKGARLSLNPVRPADYEPHKGSREAKLRRRVNKSLEYHDIYIRHFWPPKLTPPTSSCPWVVIQPWEFGFLPKEWVQVFNKYVDEMWVPSSYVRQVYIDSGIPENRVYVIPNGINPRKFHPMVPSFRLPTSKRFKFLFVGGTIFRKGIDILLKAYSETFTADDDVCLVIKDMGGQSFYKGQTAREQIKALQKRDGAPEIVYIDRTLKEKDLIGLYTACDVLVHPYRGEGFGLPILEAMACGRPPIVTGAGAAMDFCSPETALLVKAEKRIYPDRVISGKELVDRAWLYEPDIEDLKAKMRWAFEHPEEIQLIGLKASEEARTRWTWEKAADKALERIAALRSKPVLRLEYSKRERRQKGLKLINEHIKLGNFDEAEALLTKLLTDFPGDEKLILEFARVALGKGLPEQAIKRLEPILKSSQLSAEALYLAGLAAFQLQAYSRAEALLRGAIDLKNDFWDARRQLGLTLLEMERFNEGIQVLQDILKENPREIQTIIEMAKLFLEVDRTSEALSYLKAAQRLEPDNKAVQELLSIASN